MRAMVSVEPPAGNGTTTETAFCGQAAPAAMAALLTAAPAANAMATAAHTAFPDLMVLGSQHPLVVAALAWLEKGASSGTPPVVEVGRNHWELVVFSMVEAGVVRLPTVDHVLVGATPYEGPLYAPRGGECTRLPFVPNIRQLYRRFSGEAALSELPVLAIVVR